MVNQSSKYNRSSGPISRYDANSKIEAFLQIKKRWFKKVRAFIQLFRPCNKADSNFFGNERNAFIFDKDNVLKFFFDTDNNGRIDTSRPNENTEYLMVILGVHSENVGQKDDRFVIGSPTIIIAGVKEDTPAQSSQQSGDDGSEFTTTYRENGETTSISRTEGDYPAYEWPDQHTIVVLPPGNRKDADTQEIRFKLLK